MQTSDKSNHGATAVISHRVRDDRQSDYDNWLNEITPLCKSAQGHLDWQLVRPIAGLTETYTIIIRFDTQEHLRQWMSSHDRKRLIEKVRPLLVVDDTYTIHSGLDFWFTPASANVKVPVRWKQFVVTWSAIYPLALGVPLLVTPMLQPLGWHDSRFISTLFGTAAVVFLMTYIVMPHYTKLIQRWLFN